MKTAALITGYLALLTIVSMGMAWGYCSAAHVAFNVDRASMGVALFMPFAFMVTFPLFMRPAPPKA